MALRLTLHFASSLETDDVHGILSKLESPDELFELVAEAYKIDATAFCKHLDKVL